MWGELASSFKPSLNACSQPHLLPPLLHQPRAYIDRQAGRRQRLCLPENTTLIDDSAVPVGEEAATSVLGPGPGDCAEATHHTVLTALRRMHSVRLSTRLPCYVLLNHAGEERRVRGSIRVRRNTSLHEDKQITGELLLFTIAFVLDLYGPFRSFFELTEPGSR